ncbi:hypothetical protein [Dyadobacter sp. CY351]|uniref:hypothetical protein n=1 Tax=Dyadobacter sp. CY351 TaxID=2909337 RepID=UPI001F1AAD47|nr:hypothetical protein [Dyadobacter sp. CY351]MCF2516643.1 hypothetical protein [Dyadobacter sp. CY351]
MNLINNAYYTTLIYILDLSPFRPALIVILMWMAMTSLLTSGRRKNENSKKLFLLDSELGQRMKFHPRLLVNSWHTAVKVMVTACR